MMVRKLAALLAILGVVVLFVSWISHQALGRPTLLPDEILNWGIFILVGYFLIGLFVAKIGISLVREMIADRRSREEEQRARARSRFETLVEAPPAGGASTPAKTAPDRT